MCSRALAERNNVLLTCSISIVLIENLSQWMDYVKELCLMVCGKRSISTKQNIFVFLKYNGKRSKNITSLYLR